jgi:predicted nucleic acid-binding OB-fold protein
VAGTRFADITLDYSAEIAIAQDSTQLLDRLDLLLTGKQLTASARDTIRAAMEDVVLTATSTNADRLRRVQIGVALILASSDYLIQK